ncbi:MAG: hypothetical protein K2P77_12695 [Burkholderiaceae bacterium]|nr:hypothetical protein [Burkholderiaceae bacterium]
MQCCALLLSMLLATSAAARDGTQTVNRTPAQVQLAILRAVQQQVPQAPDYRRYRLAIPYGSPLFPPDADWLRPPVDGAISAWLALAVAQRRHDLLLMPDVDYYWPAEGRQYTCQFLIHIDAVGVQGSQLRIFQVRPLQYGGRSFKLLGRTGPGNYLDLRPTTPSPSSAAALQEFLRTALNAPHQ